MTREEFLANLPVFVKNYRPTPDGVDHIKHVSVLMLIGPSGVGKTTLINNLGLKHVLTDTTRPARPGETDSVDFFFRVDYEKIVEEIKKGQFAQLLVGVSGDLYGTRASSYPEKGMVVMAVLADVIPIFRNLGFKATISAFIVPPSFEEWQRRLSAHNLSPEQLKKRLSEGQSSLEFAMNDEQTHMILNDDLDTATKQLKGLVKGQIDADLEQKAKLSAQNLLSRLELINK